MNVTDLLFGLPPRQLLAITTGLSIALYALAANAGWALAHNPPPSRGLANKLSSLRSTWVSGVAREIARWLYYLGLPYAALMLGYDTVRALGVWNLDWTGAVLSAVLLLFGSVLVTIWIWRPFAKSQHPHAVDESQWNWARHVVEGLYQQAHWAFYRSGPILWLGNYYWGSFIGLGLALAEGWTNPNVRGGVREVTRADAPLWTGSLAVVTTIIFIYTQNLWYCLGTHLVLDLGFRTIIGFPRIRSLAGLGYFDYESSPRLFATESESDDDDKVAFDANEVEYDGADGVEASEASAEPDASSVEDVET